MLDNEIQKKIDTKTKPPGSLGKLEAVAYRIAKVQNTLEPKLTNPHMFVFAADHGVVAEGISPYPQEVTVQMVANFQGGGAAVSVFCRQNRIALKVIDAGVKGDTSGISGVVQASIAAGTKNFAVAPAMSEDQLDLALKTGAEFVAAAADAGCNIIALGEMGIGNTTSAAAIMSAITGLASDLCVGAGTGLDSEGVKHKGEVVARAIEFHGVAGADARRVLAAVGGFEIAMMTGATLEAARRNILVLVDGFIATAANLAGVKMDSQVSDVSIYTHRSGERGHSALLDYLGADPLLDLGMRLGEGSGAAVAYPLVESSVRFFNEMASFESAGVSDRD